MLNISLSNQIKGSAIESVEFQLTENNNRSIISYSDGTQADIPTRDFLKSSQENFKHPLLEVDDVPVLNEMVLIEYEGLNELALVTRKVYVSFIRHYPDIKTIKVKPKRGFQTEHSDTIAFASGPNKPCRRISLNQFERLIGQRDDGELFHYSNEITFDSCIELADLNNKIDIKSLFSVSLDKNILKLKTHDKFQIRYFSDFIGVGVYANRSLMSGEYLGYYSGRIITQTEFDRTEESNYLFWAKDSAQKVYVDAKNRGNITAFINHAPSIKQAPTLLKKPVHCANATIKHENFYGLPIIVFKALRKIDKGEQLFIDYGEIYWIEPSDRLYFGTSAEIIDEQGRVREDYSYISIETLRLMHNSRLLPDTTPISRPWIALTSILLLLLLLNHW